MEATSRQQSRCTSTSLPHCGVSGYHDALNNGSENCYFLCAAIIHRNTIYRRQHSVLRGNNQCLWRWVSIVRCCSCFNFSHIIFSLFRENPLCSLLRKCCVRSLCFSRTVKKITLFGGCLGSDAGLHKKKGTNRDDYFQMHLCHLKHILLCM